MRKSTASLSLIAAVGGLISLVNSASASVLVYEPFNYTSTGTAIAGKVNTQGPTNLTWNEAGTSTSPVHQIASGNLTGPTGFPASVGNSGNLEQSDNTEYDRINLDKSYGPSSVLYYSVLIDVPSLTGLTTANSNTAANNGVFIGFNNQMNASGTRPSVWTGGLTMRLGATAGTYDIGLRSSAHSGSQSNNSYWTADLTPGTTYLAVVRYTAGATAFNGGLSELWIDPSSATFGTDEADVPAADGNHAGHAVNSGSDTVSSLILGSGIQTGFDPNTINVDEIRVGTTWADVTAVPEPVSASLLGLGAMTMLGKRRRHA